MIILEHLTSQSLVFPIIFLGFQKNLFRLGVSRFSLSHILLLTGGKIRVELMRVFLKTWSLRMVNFEVADIFLVSHLENSVHEFSVEYIF
jgi:hypothetical protein